MKPAYLTIIKNEENLIYHNLLYYYNLGIRDFYVMFNNSNKATVQRVHDFIDTYRDIKYHSFYDKDIAYKQPERLKSMAEVAFKNGCDWIIPVDADEIIRIKGYKIIQEYLNNFENCKSGYINMSWIDYHPPYERLYDKSFDNYFLEWPYRGKKRKESKIIVKWSNDMRFGDGHHLLTAGRNLITNSKIMYVAHFPGRSYNQLRKKLITIGKAFIPVFGQDSKRPQVQTYHEIEKRGEIVFHEKWNRLIKYRRKMHEKQAFIYDPISPSFFMS